MRRMIVLLLAAGLLSVHHGMPVASGGSAMDHHGSIPTSVGMALLCVGVIASAAVSLRRFSVRLPGRPASDRLRAVIAPTATSRARTQLSRPPPQRPVLALLCVNRR
jgi:hypothetical protein